MASAQAKATSEEHDAEADAANQTKDARDGIPVTTAQPKVRTPRTTQEDESADHSEHAQEEAHEWRRTRARSELTKDERSD